MRSEQQSLVAILGAALLAAPTLAAPLSTAKVLRLVDGREVFVNEKPAQVNQTARSGSILSTRKSRAELLFDSRAIGLLGRNSLIKVGAKCFSLDQGIIVVNGPQKACIGTRVLGVRGTTYVAAKEEDGTYTVSVLAGEGIVANDLPEGEDERDILSTYPRTEPWASAQAGGFGAVYPSGNGTFTGGLTYFTPIQQSQSRSILYSSTSIGSSFQNAWGAGTEIGYRWFSPGSQSTSSVYLGYSGYSAPSCFSNQVTMGAQWEKSRWRLGASGAVKANSCPSSFGFGALNLSIPVGRVAERPVYVMVTPYLLAGNAVGTSALNATNSSYSPGLRATVEVPVNQAISLRGYTGADTVFGLIVGGSISYRIPTRRAFQSDPNMPTGNEVSAPDAKQSSLGAPAVRELAQLALRGQSELVSDVNNPLLTNQTLMAQGSEANVIQQGQRGRFSASGELLSIEAIPNTDFLALINGQLKGQNPLPESRRIANQAQAKGVLTNAVAGILGVDFLANASLPVSATVDAPFTPLTQLPVGRYVCAATPQARAVGSANAGPGQFNYRGEAAYLGKGSKTSQGYPATTNKADAYVFSDPGVCAEINRLANQGYDVVQAEAL